jgi:glycosyltransferase involved in cell wall biosynthesis
LPIITTNTGAAELMDGNGFIVEKRSNKMIEEAIAQYIQCPNLIKMHGNRSRRIAEQHSWEACMQQYAALFNRIIR